LSNPSANASRNSKNPATPKPRYATISSTRSSVGLTPKLRAATADSEKAVLQNAVTATDQQIDALVYDLYGLTEDEIKLVEGAP
jgi:hypothetical protein